MCHQWATIQSLPITWFAFRTTSISILIEDSHFETDGPPCGSKLIQSKLHSASSTFPRMPCRCAPASKQRGWRGERSTAGSSVLDGVVHYPCAQEPPVHGVEWHGCHWPWAGVWLWECAKHWLLIKNDPATLTSHSLECCFPSHYPSLTPSLSP